MSHRDIGVYSQISVLFDKTKNDVGVVNETFVYSIKTDRSVKVSILSSGRDAIQEEEFFKNPFEAIAFIKEKNLINFQKIHNELIFLTNPGQIKPGLEKFRQAGF